MHGIAVTLLTRTKSEFRCSSIAGDYSHGAKRFHSFRLFQSALPIPSCARYKTWALKLVLVDIDSHNVQRAVNAIELIHSNHQ